MTGGYLRSNYPACILEPGNDEEKVATQVKRLSKEILQPLLSPLERLSTPLLRRITSSDERRPSTLEAKMLAGAAPPKIIADAKSLRANAVSRTAELRAAGGLERHLESIQEALIMRAHAVELRHAGHPSPAAGIWADLLDRMPDYAKTVDPNNLFGHPDLLLGEVCDLSDRCQTAWGVADG